MPVALLDDWIILGVPVLFAAEATLKAGENAIIIRGHH